MNCAGCKEKACSKGKDCTGVANDVKEAYRADAEVLKSLRISAALESRYYMKKNRIEELILYAEAMGYEKVGVAFCIGLEKEAELLFAVLSQYFVVSSVCCKVCGIDKSSFGLPRLHRDIHADNGTAAGAEREAMCNPIGQAMILNKETTDLNIILGLCIGHDTVFTNYSDAPVTTLAVKDRVLAHNPLGALYSGYHRKRLKQRTF